MEEERGMPFQSVITVFVFYGKVLAYYLSKKEKTLEIQRQERCNKVKREKA